MPDPSNGSVIWQTYTVSEAELAVGACGASVWSTPTYDSSLGLVFVTTGNNFSHPSTGTSDAVIALDAKTGAIVWVNQRTANDVLPTGPQADFGDSPQVYFLSTGRKVGGAGEKNGFYYVLDAATGALVNQTQYEPGGHLGGFFADSGVANGIVYANGVNWPGFASGALPIRGDVFALSGDGTQMLWDFQTPQSPNISGVAIANGVVYFTSLFSGKLYALSAATGVSLAEKSIGQTNSGPAVANGRIYVGTGSFFANPAGGGSVVCLGH